MAERSFRERLVAAREHRIFGEPAFRLLAALGVELPRTVQVGRNLQLPHGALGLVIHERTVIGDDVKIFQGVTIGRSDQHTARPVKSGRVEIGNGVILGAGCAVLFRSGQVLTVGAGAVVGANAVVVSDVPAGEVWAGIPAHRVGAREPLDAQNTLA